MSSETPPDDLASQWRHFIGGLCDVVASYLERDGSAVALIATIIARLCRRGDRLMALVARFKAGTLRAPRGDRAARPHSAAPRALDPVPRGRAYLTRLLKHEAAVYGRILEILLAEPEMAALLAASPQAGRLLRPLWRMLSQRRYPPVLRPLLVLRPLPRDAATLSSGPARVCPAPRPQSPPVLPPASPGPQRSPPLPDDRLPWFAPPIPT